MTTIEQVLSAKVSRKFPVVSPFSYEADLKDFLTKNGLSANQGTVTTYAMYAAMRHYLIPGEPAPHCTFGGQDYDYTGALAANLNDADIPRGMVEVAKGLLDNQMEKAMLYVVDLAGANQVSSLDERNVQSYFLAAGVDIQISPIMKSIPYFSSILSKMVDSPLFQASILEFDWLRYHTTYASGNGLVLRVLESTGTTDSDPGPFNVPGHIVKAVEEAVKNPWDKEASDDVPMTLKGIAHVYLEAIGMLPIAKWYQGEKGRSNLTLAAISAVRAYAVTTTKLKANVGAIEKAADVAAANAALAATHALPAIM